MNLKSNKSSNKNVNLTIALYKLFRLNISHIANIDQEIECSNCGSNKKIFYYSKCDPDFNANILPIEIFKKFYLKALGKCLNCELIQDYNRFNEIELNKYEKFLQSKDIATAEEIWHTFPVPEEEKLKIFNRIYKKRLSRWQQSLKINENYKNILFLRPSLGLISKYFYNNSNANFYFVEISDISSKTIEIDFPKLKKLNGSINGYYSGEFLNKKNFFDLIVSHHNIVHCFNVEDTFKKIKSLLKDKGQAIFIEEIIVKPQNPFHINFWDEKIFLNILKKHFKEINILRDCGPDSKEFPEYSFISDYTSEGDNPDFIVTGHKKNKSD